MSTARASHGDASPHRASFLLFTMLHSYQNYDLPTLQPTPVIFGLTVSRVQVSSKAAPGHLYTSHGKSSLRNVLLAHVYKT